MRHRLILSTQASQTYAMNVAGDRAEILPAAPAEDGVYYYEDHDDERELDVGGLMALLAVAQVCCPQILTLS